MYVELSKILVKNTIQLSDEQSKYLKKMRTISNIRNGLLDTWGKKRKAGVMPAFLEIYEK